MGYPLTFLDARERLLGLDPTPESHHEHAQHHTFIHCDVIVAERNPYCSNDATRGPKSIEIDLCLRPKTLLIGGILAENEQKGILKKVELSVVRMSIVVQPNSRTRSKVVSQDCLTKPRLSRDAV